MNEVILQTLYFIGSYIGIVLILFFTVNFLSKGWLSCYLRVKSSRGKRIMIHVLSKTDTYYKHGQFIKDVLQYKTRDKKKQNITEVKREDLWYEGGIHHILLDEKTGTIYPYANKTPIHSGITPGASDEMIHRAITAPTQDDTFRKIIFAVMIIMLIAQLIVAFVLVDLRTAILSVAKISGVI